MPDAEVRTFPLQTSRHVPPGPLQIPWSVAEKAYGAYAALYGRGQSLERLAERGGFGWCEMDALYPPWREEVSELVALRAEVARLKRGDFTPEEFQALCHYRDERPGCTRAEFERGCREYQAKLFGPPCPECAGTGYREVEDVFMTHRFPCETCKAALTPGEE